MDGKPAITRRTMLATLSGIAAVSTGIKTVAAAEPSSELPRRPSRKISKVEKEYLRLLPLWQGERKQFSPSSDTHDYWRGPHGRAIIALGPAIIPYLIQELRRGDFFFNVPLEWITNADISNGNTDLSEQDNAQLWLKWWDGTNLETKR
jgi:hypothetical protein